VISTEFGAGRSTQTQLALLKQQVVFSQIAAIDQPSEHWTISIAKHETLQRNRSNFLTNPRLLTLALKIFRG
jgi:hypothetical protein